MASIRMARSKDGYKHYEAGDPIHIVVTQDFVDDANRFFRYCREKGYNPSQIIRQAMADWMERQEGSGGGISETSGEGSDFDDKVMALVKERGAKRNKMSLRTVKEILDEQ
ncbi:MAG: hypothetical protein R6V01_05240 [Thermoplasmatota archaeon]